MPSNYDYIPGAQGTRNSLQGGSSITSAGRPVSQPYGNRYIPPTFNFGRDPGGGHERDARHGEAEDRDRSQPSPAEGFVCSHWVHTLGKPNQVGKWIRLVRQYSYDALLFVAASSRSPNTRSLTPSFPRG